MSESSVEASLFSFGAPRHDRDAARRTDADGLEQAWSDPTSRVLVVAAGTVATDGAGLRWLPPGQAPSGDRVYLGHADGASYLAVLVDHVPAELVPRSVRAVAADLDTGEGLAGGLLVHAVGLANWHATHRFCSRCGAVTQVTEAGHTRTCPTCGATHFPRTDPAVIMLVTDEQDRALLGRHAAWPPGRFSTLAGFVEPGEPLEAAVRREIAEEVGLDVDEVTYAGNQPWPFPSSLMLGFFARALSTDVRVDEVEIADARWFSRDELAAAAATGEVVLSGHVSISRWLIDRWLIDRWHGGELVGDLVT